MITRQFVIIIASLCMSLELMLFSPVSRRLSKLHIFFSYGLKINLSVLGKGISIGNRMGGE